MSPDKGVHLAIAAARQAGVPLVLAAKMRSAEERSYFDEQVAPMLGADAVFEGEVEHERKVELLAGARRAALPIEWNEPFGLVMIEALATGTPVIAYRNGAAPEVIDDGATVFSSTRSTKWRPRSTRSLSSTGRCVAPR